MRHRRPAIEFRFQPKGERHLPTALASMTAKYLRELAMRPFNAFWQRHVPELRPTAGYNSDAKRFIAEIAAAKERLGIADHMLWRERERSLAGLLRLFRRRRRGGRLELGGGDLVVVVEVAIGFAGPRLGGGAVEGVGEIDLRAQVVEALAEVAVHAAELFGDVRQVLAEEQNGHNGDDEHSS